MSDTVTERRRLVRATYVAMMASWEWYLAGIRVLHPEVPDRVLRKALKLMVDAAGGDSIKGGAIFAELVQSFKVAGYTAKKPVAPRAETVMRLEQEIQELVPRRRRTSRK
jgi:hypothetical protein